MALYAMGGILMGLGTRLANFSLSGWVFFAALIGGGIFGNRVVAKIK